MIRLRSALKTIAAFLALSGALALLPACRNSARAAAHVEKGNDYFEHQQFSLAEGEYREALQVDPASASANYRLGLLQLKSNHPTAALRSFSRAVDLDPKNQDARLHLADLQIASTQYSEARQQAEALVQLDAKNPASHRLLGQIALRQRQYIAAENEFKQAIALDPRAPRAYQDLGLAQLLDSEFGAAEKTFQAAVDASPGDPGASIDLANFYKGQGSPDRAEIILQQGMAKSPEAVELPIALAAFYLERSRAPEAKRLLDQIEADTNHYPGGWRAVADFYLGHGDAAAAIERFRALASANGNDRNAAKKVAECDLALGRWQDAKQWIDLHDPQHTDPDFTLLRARSDLGAFRLREASAELQSLMQNSPDLPAVYFYLSQVYSAQEQPLQAQESLIEAIRVQPGYLPALLGLGDASLQQSHPNEALAYASQIIASSFWVAEAHILAGSSYLMLGDAAQAQRAFELAAGLNPRSAAAQERLGRVLASQGNNVAAQKAYEASLSIAPDNAPALAGLSDLFVKEGKPQLAGARIDRQISAQPRASQLYVAKAEACIAQKNWACAESSYQQVLKLNPYYVNGYLALAHIYAATNRPQNMIQEYETARGKFPEYLPTYLLLAQVYQYVGNFDAARQTYQTALSVDPNSYQAMSGLAVLYADHGGSLSDALDLAQKARTAQPDDPAVNDALGWVYYKQGLFRSAVPVLEAAVAKNSQAAKFQFHLGMAYIAAGQTAQARSTLQTALQIGLAAEDARAAQEALQKSGS